MFTLCELLYPMDQNNQGTRSFHYCYCMGRWPLPCHSSEDIILTLMPPPPIHHLFLLTWWHLASQKSYWNMSSSNSSWTFGPLPCLPMSLATVFASVAQSSFLFHPKSLLLLVVGFLLHSYSTTAAWRRFSSWAFLELITRPTWTIWPPSLNSFILLTKFLLHLSPPQTVTLLCNLLLSIAQYISSHIIP